MKEKTEREPFNIETVKAPNTPAWVIEPKAETASPFYCAACGYSIPTCAHRVLEVARSTPTGAVLWSASARKEMRR